MFGLRQLHSKLSLPCSLSKVPAALVGSVETTSVMEIRLFPQLVDNLNSVSALGRALPGELWEERGVFHLLCPWKVPFPPWKESGIRGRIAWTGGKGWQGISRCPSSVLDHVMDKPRPSTRSLLSPPFLQFKGSSPALFSFSWDIFFYYIRERDPRDASIPGPRSGQEQHLCRAELSS